MNYQKEINLKTFIEKHITRNEKCLILENGKKKEKKMAKGIPNSIANNMFQIVSLCLCEFYFKSLGHKYIAFRHSTSDNKNLFAFTKS